jgi:hypothetical protein
MYIDTAETADAGHSHVLPNEDCWKNSGCGVV